ncbi:hypothetical protein H634G_00141 [Metarhizium anisopliae BRIP 53293]|uniref:Period circadian protein n=1 Tax=Metarhizium anisopliae BRIP 53293 TaxID=1291518 RepID=A0A0D9PIH2_METAN|nr:hypothetical protein H634G_00141 [Metarhizium anisopliae BRIP 53293]KJK91492.1 hypothetical protein H633G_04639 [Metarhizium anisopliae BRIP 53284]
MSSIVNKVKEVLHSDKDKTTRHEETHSSTHPTTTGTHTTSAAEPRIHDTTTTGPVGGTTGTHDTSFAGSDNYTYGSGANRGASGPASKTDGPHNSNLLNKADPRVDSDRDHSKNLGMNPQGTATTGTTTGTGIGGTQHHSGVAGTTALGGDRTTGPATRTDGPHQSNLANKADPRVDSDRDHSRNLGMNPHGTATTGTTGGLGSAGTTGAAIGTTGLNRGSDGPATRTDGPHESNLANKADPRVDSDRDHSRNLGANPHGTATTGTTGTTGSHGTHTGAHGTHAGIAGTTGTGDNAAFFSSGTSGATGINRGTDGPATRTDGPHESNLANKADPRVDSDRDHSRNLGANPHGTATTGTTGTTGSYGTHTGTHGTHAGTTGTHVGTAGTTTGTYGTHGTHAGTTGTHVGTAGTTTGTHGTHAGTTGAGPGPAPNTAGPHKSDLLNKADPRVDSDLDGSKTFGGNKTSESMGHKDPTDAAQVPPSVLQKHIGAPTVEHDHAKHDHTKRHSVSHQEQHRGL